jgi:hypothetical protein
MLLPSPVTQLGLSFLDWDEIYRLKLYGPTWKDEGPDKYINYLTRMSASMLSPRDRFKFLLNFLGSDAPTVVYARYGSPLWIRQDDKATIILSGMDEEIYQQGVALLVYHVLWMFDKVPSSTLFALTHDNWLHDPRFLVYRRTLRRVMSGEMSTDERSPRSSFRIPSPLPWLARQFTLGKELLTMLDILATAEAVESISDRFI